jgi:PIN domain nuclease of toxin-antitoxin system
MKFLLDTHVLLWLLGAPDRVPEHVRDQLADPANTLSVSAVSALEVATKERLGKMPSTGLVASWSSRVGDIGATELAVESGHALLAGSMRWAHRDPFDRLLVAQATIEAMTLVTVDPALRDLPSPPMLTW